MTAYRQYPMTHTQWALLAAALVDYRDALTELSLSVKDLMAESYSPKNEAVAIEVDRYLLRFRDTKQDGKDSAAS